MKLLPQAALAAALFASTLVTGYTVSVAPVAAHGAHKAASGAASYYGKRFHGRTTANGEKFNMNSMTAAHKTLPFGTKVRVTNQRNGKSVVVRINDRGPYAGGRVIDLSKAAASKIGMIQSGTARVRLDII
ncbi:septal ring lytic transglycosylase RlpA family protein [Aurantimonas sp. A3-2-R12]|uniref:septal ring lytic transglycosylase RlpA family protein n=1 Tax=Aurantimonas sp. A3-2-R12 TaxID=3114362 RepID=UPI002E191A7A|nr:septal ring lytic transglycosylase RlpA family protein [Aurantimonas sp. A3-2-R12]